MRTVTPALRAPLRLLVLTLASATVTSLAAQTPRARIGQFEVPGLDFRPDGAWRKEARAVRDNRHQLMKRGSMAALNSPIAGSTLIAGTYNIPVLPISFFGGARPFPASQYETVLFGTGGSGLPYTTNYYYHELSNGAVTINGIVHEWVQADSADTYYEDNCNGIGIDTTCAHGGASGDARFASLLPEILAKVDDGTFDWLPFDKDGDGVVDFVTFLQADQDGACGPRSNKHIWAHRFNLSGLRGSPYTTKTTWPGHPGQFIKVDDYIIQSAQGGSTACQPGQIMPIGIITHETGHAFGLPDLYDTDLRTEGVGEWSLMGSGGYTQAYSPARYDAWSAAELGWIKVDTLNSTRSVNLGPVQTSDTILYAAVPGTDEYFYFENRASLQSDTAQMNPAFGRHKQPGLLIWHLDQGQIDAHGITQDNRVNALSPHGVELVQADGLGNLDATDNTSNRGDPGDAYPGSTVNRRFSFKTRPAALSNGGAAVGWIIDSIADPDGAQRLHFRFIKQAATVVHASPSTALVRVGGPAVTSYSDIEGAGDSLVLDLDSLQLLSSGRSRLLFLNWSDGGAKAHTHIAPGPAETITANFSAENRVLLSSSVGAGTVAASVSGSLTTGIYVTAGTPVTLTATPAIGQIFAAWSGDTSSVSPTLALPMTRGYNVVATFTGEVAVTTAAATTEILGTSALSTEQKTFLDQVGNANGSYDLGDYLALLKRNGAAVPPAVAKLIKAAQTRKEH